MLEGSCEDSDQGFTMAVIGKKKVTGNVEMRKVDIKESRNLDGSFARMLKAPRMVTKIMLVSKR